MMAALRDSTCEICQSYRPSYHSKSQTNASRIAIVISPWMDISRERMVHPLVTLAANWIIRGHFVDVHYLHDSSCRNDTPTDIISKIAITIMNAMPCDVVMAGNKPLLGKSIELNDLGLCEGGLHRSSLVEDKSPFAQVSLVEPILKTIQETSRESIKYELILVDASNAAGVFWAELLKVPIVMLATPNHLDLITGENPPWQGVWDALQRRVKQFRLGWQFSQMNQIRKHLGLKLFSLPSDYFDSAVEVLLYPPIDYKHSLPANIRPIFPFTPQCVSCDRNFPMRHNITVAIMPMDLTLTESRAILRGINLARMSFQQQASLACDLKEGSPECLAFQLKADLRAVMLVEGWPVPYVPELIPSFLAVESSHILEAITRHTGMAVVVSHCDQYSTLPSIVTGLPLICIPKKDQKLDAFAKGGWVTSARGNDIARAVIRAIMEGKKKFALNRTSGLSNPLLVLETLAMIRKEKRLISLERMRSLMKKRLPFSTNQAAPISNHVSWKFIFTCLLLGFLLLAMCYAHLFLEHVSDPSQIPAFHRKHPMGSGLFAEMDPALMHFQLWLRDSNALHNVVFKSTLPEKRESSPELVRRRKVIKKR